ncbi:MAG: cytochrome [Verrucomicrobiales bacterium]|nr:cytochrome [Verrucomicrobiales bacterium]
MKFSLLLPLPLVLLATFALAQPPAENPVSAPAAAAPQAAVPIQSGGPSTPRKFELPPETGTYRPGDGVAMAQALCLTCHSTEYCEMQPPLPAKYWEATVKKMKEKFGATLPDESIAPLVKYLSTAYGKKE